MLNLFSKWAKKNVSRTSGGRSVTTMYDCIHITFNVRHNLSITVTRHKMGSRSLVRALGLHLGEERAISGLHITGVDPQQAMQVIVSEPGPVLVFLCISSC